MWDIALFFYRIRKSLQKHYDIIKHNEQINVIKLMSEILEVNFLQFLV